MCSFRTAQIHPFHRDYSRPLFQLYCPYQDDHEESIQQYLSETQAEQEVSKKVSLRYGVFTDVQQEPDHEERFVRAKIAADRM